jgi:DNA-binding MarR family transcriptional regulator
LSLTPAGDAAYQRLLPRIAAVNQALLAGLSEAELAQLDGLLARLHQRAVAMTADA